MNTIRRHQHSVTTDDTSCFDCSSISRSITTLTDGSWIFDVVHDGLGGASFSTTGSGQTAQTLTSASVSWENVPAWDTQHEQGEEQRTPDLSSIIEEIVGRTGQSQWRK